MDDAQLPTTNEAELAEPVLVPPRGLWAVALALFVLTAAAAILWAPPLRPRLQPSLVLDTWHDADLAGVRAADDALLKRVPTAPEQVALERKIWAQFSQFLQMEVALAGQTADNSDARLTLGAAEESVRTLVQRYGAEALSRLSVQFGRNVRAAVERSLAAARAAKQPFAQHLAAQPLPEDVSALTALAGALGATLERTGIERQWHNDQLDPAAGQVIETIAQARFLQLGARVPGGAPQLSSAAWLLVQHFRLEAHAGLDLQRRLALLDEFATTDPAYPSDYARGVLLAREELYAQAAPWFLRASKHGPFARQARDNARWCQERAAAAKRP